MNNKIQSILTDLYALDPQLKKHELQLITIITQLLKVRPDVTPDKQFVRRLREQLIQKNVSQPNSLFSLFTMKKLSFSLLGATLTALIIVPALYLGGFFSQDSSEPGGALLAVKSQVTRLQENAFGQLTADQNAAQPLAEAARGFGGGGTGVATTQAVGADVALGAPVTTDEAGKMIAPFPYYQYRYVYTGDPLELTEDKLAVYKRVIDSPSGLSGVLRNLNLGLLDLASFQNARLEQFSFFEDRTNGLRINVSLTDGSIGIYENTQYTEPVRQLTEADVPSDESVIALADAFLSQHGISTEGLGQPEVRDEWRLYLAETSSRGEIAYVPQTVTVVYPFVVDNQIVHDQSGYPDGLQVNVDIVNNRAVGLWNLRTQNYQSSLYAAETNTDRILEFARRGGVYPIYEDPQAQILEVELGTPELRLIRMFDYVNNQSQELLVPALIFPITKEPSNAPYPLYQRSVVIPVIKDILDRNLDQPRIMPLDTQPGGAVQDKPVTDISVTEPAIAL